MEQKIKIKLTSRRTEIAENLLRSLFDAVLGEEAENILFTEGNGNDSGVSEDTIEMNTEGVLRLRDGRFEIAYDESELTGMQGSVTAIGFEPLNPGLVSMVRTGPVRTAMTFEEGKRHICLYNTPFSEFEVCVRTLKVNNRLLEENKLELDYLIEIHGAQAEHCKMTVTVRPSGEIEVQ